MALFKKILFVLTLFQFGAALSQSAWPSESWTSAINLTSVMGAGGLNELSGLYWNPFTNRLYVIHGDGRLRVLQFNTATHTFSQIANKTIDEGPEGITQADLSANEFYTIDENNYEIRKFTHTANFSSVTQSNHWDLLTSPMTDTGNSGPEGIAFIPDASLVSAGFISQQTGALYTSSKGMGGLLFVAHQNAGYIWVFDVNPNVDNDFLYVGKYLTNRSESCDLSFDSSTGLLYILHNLGSNFLEVTDLSSVITGGTTRKFTVVNEYLIANPTGNNNIEGFAVTPKCPESNNVSAFLCRDVESNESSAFRQDCIRWFNPFNSDGTCAPLANESFSSDNIKVYPNPAQAELTVSMGSHWQNSQITIRNMLAQTVMVLENDGGVEMTFDISALPNGFYFLEIRQGKTVFQIKWMKE